MLDSSAKLYSMSMKGSATQVGAVVMAKTQLTLVMEMPMISSSALNAKRGVLVLHLFNG
jgi:hypothetical protein